MEIFFIFLLGVVVFSVWQSGRETAEQLRGEIRMLEREIGWLREQLAALVKARAATPVSAPEAVPAKPPAPAPMPVTPVAPQVSSPVRPLEPTAVHAAPAAIAAFPPPAKPPAAPLRSLSLTSDSDRNTIESCPLYPPMLNWTY